MNISILGTGGWGTALGILLNSNGHSVKMWSIFEEEINELNETRENKFLKDVKIPEEIEFTNNLDYSINNADLIVLAVPSHVVRSTCRLLSRYSKLPTIVNVAKGFDGDTDERLSVVIKNELNTDKIVVLSGPTHAEEVSLGVPTAIVAASEKIEYAKLVQDIFMNNNFRVYTNTDVTGAEVSGALKNIIALCAGISDGCGFGDNTKAALMTRGIKEISRLGVAMGGKFETFMGLTGIGDLIVTCTSMHSRNRRAGILIGKGMTAEEAKNEVKMVVEGINCCKCAYELAKKYKIEMPIVNTAYNIIYKNMKPQEAVYELMARDKKHE